ncbi:MAG: hypothetical protein NTV49_02960 [Kiritimatiellaeota bacterium]|nr:hypothetical protein [Kiritimatiellota bacterium]
MTTEQTNEDQPVKTNWDATLAFWVLRVWLGVRAIVTGLEKYSTTVITQKPLMDPTTGMEDASGALVDIAHKVYALTNYNAVPPSLASKFATEPLLPKLLLTPFYALLGPVLILLGVTLLIGLGTRISLFLQGLLYVGLTVGMILIHEDGGIAWLGIHVALIALALLLARHNRFGLLKNG